MQQDVDSAQGDAARRLAQYRPFEEGGRDLHAVLRELAIAVAEINGGQVANLQSCCDGFKDLWGLDVEIDEIRRVRSSLIQDGSAEQAAGGFRLTIDLRSELQAKAAASEEAEQGAFAQWEDHARSLRADLTRADLDAMREDLNAWINKIVARHGAEAALLLYPDAVRTRRLFENIDQLGTRFLPERSPAVSAVRDDALRDFVRQPTADQRTYLAGRLNTAFYLTVLTLDPAATKLTQENARGSRLYLDTNVLYAVLGAASDSPAHANA
jgi:hypothetical protein